VARWVEALGSLGMMPGSVKDVFIMNEMERKNKMAEEADRNMIGGKKVPSGIISERKKTVF
jgi:hypothetical protein